MGFCIADLVDEKLRAACEREWISDNASDELHNKIIAHQPGLRLNEKVGIINSFKQCCFNAGCGLPEKCTEHGIDFPAVSSFLRAGVDLKPSYRRRTNIAGMCGS